MVVGESIHTRLTGIVLVSDEGVVGDPGGRLFQKAENWVLLRSFCEGGRVATLGSLNPRKSDFA